MMTYDAFVSLAQDVARLNGLTVDQASDLVSAVGDTPDTDAAGNVLVTLNGQSYALVWPTEPDDEAP